MKYIPTIILSVLMVFPVSVSAATLTQVQVNAIISVLIAFGVDQYTIDKVALALAPIAPETSIVQIDDIPPVVSLSRTANEWKNSKFFKNGLYGVAGITDWNVVKWEKDIISIQYFVDGVSAGDPRPAASGKFALDSTRYSNGEHTLEVRATDSAGNSSRASITITVNNTN